MAPLFLLSIMLVGLLALATITLVRSFDLNAMEHEQELIAKGLSGRIDEVGRIVAPQVVWADAVRNLDNRFDPEWAQDNILSYLQETGGFKAVVILDSADRLRIAGEAGKLVDPALYAPFEQQVVPLVESIRAAEVVRAAAERGTKEVIKTSIHSEGVIMVGNVPTIIAASRVQPDFTDSRLRGIHGPIVVAAMPVDQAFLDEFGKRFLLQGLTVVQNVPSMSPANDWPAASVALKDTHGKTVAWLRWHPRRPGSNLLKLLGPGMGLAAMILIALAAWLYRRSHRMAQGLITSEARAAHLAYHDSLTGLPNRVQFGDRLARALAHFRRSNKTVTILCLDLDRFKDINDTYGHAVGDELLKEAAQRMASLCRTEDTLARLSGDEFAIIKQGGSAAEAAVMAARLCREIGKPFILGSLHLHIGCSIGITTAKRKGSEPAELLREADIALYKAKDHGKGRFCFFEHELDVAIKGRRLLETELREALGTCQLSLAYQPQVSSDGTFVGLEALMRWDHPKRGNVSPAIFIPIAEQSDLILDLGRFAITKAFSDSRRWPEFRIAINISAQQIRDPAFLGWLSRTARQMRIDPARFDFEITEGILLGDDPDTQDRLAALSKIGFGLALDDFGTGYSSLSYLNRYPINKIKIDRSFIANLGAGNESDAVVDAIIKLAKALDLGVVAEGVETEEQARILKFAGCAELQGFLFSHPVSAGDIDGLHRSLAA